jgi:Na+/H+ antiporter NhaC
MKKTVNIIMYCIYLLIVIITTYILLYLFVSKKNFESLAGVKEIFLIFPENYYTLKQDLRISNILYLFDITP